MNMIELIMPCPFCGSTNGTDEMGETYRWRLWACECGAKGPDVRCNITGSGHGGAKEARQAAIAAWNDRQQYVLQEVAAERERWRDVLSFAEAALADIGDADREPGDDLEWCEKRAAEALPRVRAALGASEC